VGIWNYFPKTIPFIFVVASLFHVAKNQRSQRTDSQIDPASIIFKKYQQSDDGRVWVSVVVE
jgi:hypothetical protein